MWLRVKRKRTSGYRTPPNTRYIGKPTIFGNPYGGSPTGLDTYLKAVIAAGLPVRQLYGMNLSCWCHLCERHKDGKPLNQDCPDCAPCHVDVIGRLLYPTMPAEPNAQT